MREKAGDVIVRGIRKKLRAAGVGGVVLPLVAQGTPPDRRDRPVEVPSSEPPEALPPSTPLIRFPAVREPSIPPGTYSVHPDSTAAPTPSPAEPAPMEGKLCPWMKAACRTVDCQLWDMDRWTCGMLPLPTTPELEQSLKAIRVTAAAVLEAMR